MEAVAPALARNGGQYLADIGVPSQVALSDEWTLILPDWTIWMELLISSAMDQMITVIALFLIYQIGLKAPLISRGLCIIWAGVALFMLPGMVSSSPYCQYVAAIRNYIVAHRLIFHACYRQVKYNPTQFRGPMEQFIVHMTTLVTCKAAKLRISSKDGAKPISRLQITFPLACKVGMYFTICCVLTSWRANAYAPLNRILGHRDGQNYFGDRTDYTSGFVKGVPHIIDMYLLVWFMYPFMCLMAGVYGIVMGLFKFESEGMFPAIPLLSHDPIDFWSKRWNSFVHNLLKSTVYEPIIESFGSTSQIKRLAVFGTFVASAVFHEYTILKVFGTQFLGWQFSFFIVNFVFTTIAVSKVPRRVMKASPIVIQIGMTTGMMMSASHLFLVPLLENNFFGVAGSCFLTLQ